MAVGDEETVRRFVLRARRVQAHSLAQDWDGLLRHAEGAFEVSLDTSGRATVTQPLPADEEVFESLASRVRPLTVKSEPVYYVKVFDAIERLIGQAGADDEHLALVARLRGAWDACEIHGTQVQAYSLQSARTDGSQATDVVSDTQLAAAWLYADLVHADATGPKKKALVLRMRDRYAAAVRVFSRMAALIVQTLQTVESLRDAGVLAVDGSAWEEPVAVGASDLVEEGRVFFGPVGGEVPDLGKSVDLGDEWKHLTVTELLRMDPAKQVRVVLRDEGSTITASYDAAVSRRQPDGTSAAWDVLVADSVLFRFSFAVQGEQVSDVRFLGLEVLDSTNELRLASIRFLLEMHGAATMVFEVADGEFLKAEPPGLDDDERRALEVMAQTLGDIVAIERLSGQELEPAEGTFDNRHRVLLRRTRLMLEGHVVRATNQPVSVKTANGSPPNLVAVAASTLDVGGAEVPVPPFLMRHPDMTAMEVGDAPGAGPEAKTYLVTPPDGERFFAWMPGKVAVSGDDDLVPTADWDLIDVDEKTFGS